MGGPGSLASPPTEGQRMTYFATWQVIPKSWDCHGTAFIWADFRVLREILAICEGFTFKNMLKRVYFFKKKLGNFSKNNKI